MRDQIQKDLEISKKGLLFHPIGIIEKNNWTATTFEGKRRLVQTANMRKGGEKGGVFFLKIRIVNSCYYKHDC